MTARDSGPVRRTALAQGCVVFLAEPFEGWTLIDAIRAAKAPL
jgi:FixJ family two-component response regulator